MKAPDEERMLSRNAERMVNLALYLASSPHPLTAAECRGAGLGYSESADEPAFLRTFERDKEALRAAGVVIEVIRTGDVEAYRLDSAATFARPIDLSADEVSALRAVAAGLASDDTFPFGDDLAIALSKLGSAGAAGPLASEELSGGTDLGQTRDARLLAGAVQTRKVVGFEYTNAAGEHKRHSIEPYGVFARGGLWYLTGRDRDLDERRTYTVARMTDLTVNERSPKTADFERPADFDIRQQERLPFQYGSTAAEARVRFEPDVAWRASRLSGGRGTLDTLPDGSVLWTIEYRDARRLASWIVDEGPGIHAVSPADLVNGLTAGLRRAADENG